MIRLIILAALFSCSSVLASDRIALLIGNDLYPSEGLFGDLDNATKDVDLLAKSLTKAGFKVITAKNADRSQMRMKIAEFESQIQPGGTALFYYGGHGIQYENENYLMGSNALLLKKYELSDEAIRAKVVVDAMTEKLPKSSFVFLDCCRSHPPKSWLQSDSRSARTRGMASMEAPGVVISFSAAPGAEATDGEGENSPYAKALAENILKGLEFDRVLKEVGRSVHDATNAQQRVWTNGNFLHDFYFTPPRDVKVARSGDSTPSGDTPELVMEIGSSGNSGEKVGGQGSAPDSGSGEKNGADRAVASDENGDSDADPNMLESDAPPETEVAVFEPIIPMVLPERGYFRNDEVFEGGAYKEYNTYSKKNIIRKAQAVLTNAGSPDGIMGKKTQGALVAYQEENSLPETGRLDQGTLEAMSLLGITEETAPVSRSSSNRSSGSRSSSGNRSRSSGSFNANQFIRNADSISRTIRRFR